MPTTHPAIRDLMHAPYHVRLFNEWALKQAERERRQSLGELLGVFWTSKAMHSLFGAKSSDTPTTEESKQEEAIRWVNGVEIPLVYMLDAMAGTKLLKNIADRIPKVDGSTGNMPVAQGDYVPEDSSETIVPMPNTKDAFFAMLSNAGIYGGAVAPRAKGASTEKVDSAEETAQRLESNPSAVPITTATTSEFKQKLAQAGVPGYSRISESEFEADE